jgi:hypothetical protein
VVAVSFGINLTVSASLVKSVKISKQSVLPPSGIAPSVNAGLPALAIDLSVRQLKAGIKRHVPVAAVLESVKTPTILTRLSASVSTEQSA